MKRTVISIDWDFFVPEKMEWDLGHAENLMFLNMVWMTRSHLLHQMTTDGIEKDFWKTLSAQYDLSGVSEVKVSDSHSYGYEAARFADNIILFDTHHDLWPWHIESESIHCGNWLRFWMLSDFRRTLTWVRSSHSDYDLTGLNDFGDRVTVLTWGEDALPEAENITDIHICRSGCWTPPWLDENFIEFVKEAGNFADCDFLNMENDSPWNALNARWGESEFAQAKEMEEQLAQYREVLA